MLYDDGGKKVNFVLVLFHQNTEQLIMYTLRHSKKLLFYDLDRLPG